MILKIVVLLGIAIYLFIEGYWPLTILAIAAIIPSAGLIIAILLAILLLISAQYWVFGILSTLIAWNLIGNYLMQKKSKRTENQMSTLNYFIDYCRTYLTDIHGLSYEDAQLLILDPELGPRMDDVKRKWAWNDLQASDDPDDILKMKDYDSQQMQRINRLIDEYRNQFKKRKSKIKDYLKSIGHPLGVD